MPLPVRLMGRVIGATELLVLREAPVQAPVKAPPGSA